MRSLLAALLFALSFPSFAISQWTEVHRQDAATNGNGALYSADGKLFLWDGEHKMHRSTDNGASWVDIGETGLPVAGANPHISRMSYANGRLYAGLNYGTGNGLPAYTTNDGESWVLDTVGAQKHALGWEGYAVVSDLHAWAGHLFVKWDAPDAFDIKSFDGTYQRNAFLAHHDPQGVTSKGNTLFISSDKLYYTTDFGVTWVTPANNGYRSGGQLLVDDERIYMLASDLYYTDDDGENWTRIDMSSITSKPALLGSQSITAYFAKGENIVIGANSEKWYNSRLNLWSSTDLGLTWVPDSNGTNPHYYATVAGLSYHSDGSLFAVSTLQSTYNRKFDDGAGSGPGIVGTPKIVSPQTGSVVSSDVVTFNWTSLPGAEAYELVIATNATFNNIVKSETSIVDTFRTVDGFTKGETYYWRVRGIASGKASKSKKPLKESRWSAVANFTVSVGGRAWEKIGFIGGVIPANLVSHKGALYASTTTSKFIGGYTYSGKVYVSKDDGRTWTKLVAPWKDSVSIEDITSAGDRLYVRTKLPSQSGEIWYTTDDQTWTSDHDGLTIDDNYRVEGKMFYWADHLMLSGGQGQVNYVKSLTDASWSVSRFFNQYKLASIGNKLFGLNDNLNNDTIMIYTTDGGATVSLASATGLPIGKPKSFLRADVEKLHIIAQPEWNAPHTIYTSIDGAATWQVTDISGISTALPPNSSAPQVMGFLSNGDNMWISFRHEGNIRRMHRSTDNGNTWTLDTSGIDVPVEGGGLLDLISHGDYVFGHDEIRGLYRQVISGETAPGIVGVATLLTPATGGVLTDTVAQFAWSSVKGATSYQLVVGTDSTFKSAAAINDSLIGSTNYSVGTLSYGTKYFWRVRGLAQMGGEGTTLGGWSKHSSFSIKPKSASVATTSVMSTPLFPNPAGRWVNLTSATDGLVSVAIIASDGRGVSELAVTGFTSRIDLTEIPAGIYQVVLRYRTGEQQVEKLVVVK